MCPPPHLVRMASVKLSLFDVLLNSSTIHGVKYFADHQSPRATRTFWICAFTLSILGCAYYAHQVYDKWYVTPDIGLKTDFKSARIAPFPAMTVCPQNKIKKSFLNFTQGYTTARESGTFDGSDDERRYFEMAFGVCTSGSVKYVNDSFFERTYLPGEDIVKNMAKSQYIANETLITTRYRNQYDDGLNGINRVITSDGFCMSFNLEDYSTLFKENSGLSEDFDNYKNGRKTEWTPLQGYNADANVSAFPYRIFSGKKNSLVLLLVQSKNDEDASCSGADVGFKIYWHMPNEIPGNWHRYVMVPPQKACNIIMKATRISTSSDLKRYNPVQRRCYFDDEKELRFFKSYTKSHCDLECLANYTLSKCGCVRFFMPHDKKTPVCNVTRFICAEDAEDEWLENDNSYQDNKMPCECYPSCAEVKYEVLMTDKNDFLPGDTLAAYGDSDSFKKDYPGGQLSRLTIVFEDFLIEDQENYLGYKMQHFISDCGGLLGLFMGCSILSLVELVYNFVITFFKRRNAIKDQQELNKKPQTPMKDNRATIVIDDATPETE